MRYVLYIISMLLLITAVSANTNIPYTLNVNSSTVKLIISGSTVSIGNTPQIYSNSISVPYDNCTSIVKNITKTCFNISKISCSANINSSLFKPLMSNLTYGLTKLQLGLMNYSESCLENYGNIYNKSTSIVKTEILTKINDEFINQRDYINNKLLPSQNAIENCQEEKTNLLLELNSQQYNLSRLLNTIETKNSVIEQQDKTNNTLMWAFVPMLILLFIMILHACGIDLVEMIKGGK